MEEHAAALRGERLGAARLLVSELVTNALMHGSGAITLAISAAGSGVRLEVCDHGRSHPRVRETAGADGGWGLRLVDRLALRWGVRDDDTRVWFEI